MEVEKSDIEWLIMLLFTLIGKINIVIKTNKKPCKKRKKRNRHKRKR